MLVTIVKLTHPRTGFIFRRIKSLFHHSNWQHIFLISFNGTSKRGVMHYNKKNIKKIWFFGQTLPICMRNSGISIIKSVANLKISWSFLIRKILRSTRTLDCGKLGSNRRGNFSLSVELSSFIFLLLYHELWVMIRNVHVLWTLCVDGLKIVWSNCSMTTCWHELHLNHLFYVYPVINEVVVLIKIVEKNEML